MFSLRLSVLLATVAVLLITFPAAVLSAGTDLAVELENDTLSVHAENIPLQSILQEIAAHGLTVKIDPAINPLVSTSFSKRPLAQGLESLLKPASYSLLWETGTGSGPSMHLAEIQVFQTGQKSRMKILAPHRTEVITKNGDNVLYVKDEVLIYVTDHTDLVGLRRLLRAYDATLVEHTGLPGLVKILLPENSDVFAVAREIKNSLELEISQPNYAYPVQAPVYLPLEGTRPDAGAAYYGPTDNNAPVAILDSGLARESDLEKFVLSSLDVVNPQAAMSDGLGHGTQMALIASGVVKPFGAATDTDAYIPIIPIRSFDDNGYTTDFKIMDAIGFALANNAKVLSLSWGSGTKSDFMGKAFTYAASKGLIVVASAGNEPTGRPVYPAAFPSVIGVGALDPHGKTWENSNYGDFVTLYAPGFADLPVGYKGDPGLYAGTSISAAFVANSIAGYLSKNPGATFQEVGEFLQTEFDSNQPR